MRMQTRLHRLIPGRRWHYADSHDMKALLGLKPNQQLPVEGMPGRSIYGVWVYVDPLVPRPGVRRNFQGLRVKAVCACGQHVAVGRLHQHRCPVRPPAPGYEE
jgi:hypothetical protein